MGESETLSLPPLSPLVQILALSSLVVIYPRLPYVAEPAADEGLEKDIEHNNQLLILDVVLPPSGKNEDEKNIVSPSDHFLRISLEMWLSGGLSVPVGLMAFVVKHLSSRELHIQVVGKQHSFHDAIQRGFLKLCEDILELLLGLSRPDEDDDGNEDEAAFEQYVQLRDSVNEASV